VVYIDVDNDNKATVMKYISGNGINEPIVQSSKFKVQCYPNPVVEMLNVECLMLNKGNVNLKILDITGREVATLMDGVKEKGEYTLKYDASDLRSGIYFVKVESGDGIAVGKFVKE
jgi:hypothetical protein